MPKPKPCTWNGIPYPSRAACAEANHVTSYAVCKWLKKGYTCDADVLAGDQRGNPKPFTYNGVRYRSISAAARARGEKVCTMYDRMKRGITRDSQLRGRQS